MAQAWPTVAEPFRHGCGSPAHTVRCRTRSHTIWQGGPMLRTLVGLLAAAGTAASGLIAYAHGNLVWVAVSGAAAATGLAAYGASPPKKILSFYTGWNWLLLL